MINKRGSTSFNDPNRFQQQLQTAKQFMPDFKDPAAVSEFYTDLILDAGTIMRSFPEDIPTGIASIVSRRTAKKLIKQPVQQLNNVSDLGFLKRVEDASGQTNLQTQAAQFINTGDDLTGMFTKGSISYNKLDEIRARYPNRSIYEKPTGRGRESRQPFIKEHELESAKAGGKIPYFLGDDSKLYFLDTKKLDQYGPGQHRYAMVDLQNKLANEAAKRATKLSKTIPIEDYILELGEELGTKAFKINKAKMKKLYRWVSEEGAHLDHMWPLVSTPTEGFHHINNLILLYSKHNLKKSNRVLPKALFEELGIPMSKRDLIRSTLEKPKTTNQFKRRRILEELGILEIK